MARVNRTTGIFLILGVAALLGTVAGARFMMGPEEKPTSNTPPDSAYVYCRGYADAPSGLLTPTPGPNIMGMGKVRAILVQDGETVKAGKVLVQLEDRTARDQLAVAQQELQVARAKLANAKEQANNDIKIFEQQNVVNRAVANYNAALINLRTAQNYSKANQHGSKENLEIAENMLQQAKKDQETAEFVLAKLKSIDPNTPLKEYEEELNAQMLRVKAAEADLENYVIKAPRDGTIVEINYQVGGPCPLPPGDAYANRALVILPKEPLVVRAEVEQDNAMMVKVGQKATVTVRSAAGREFTWTGKVEKVSAYMQKGRIHTIEPDQFVNPWTRECIISIDPDPKNINMVHGTRVSAQIYTGE